MEEVRLKSNPKAAAKLQPEFSSKDYMKFLGPSLLGILLFMIPISYDGAMTLPVAVMAKAVEGVALDALPWVVTILMGLTVVGTLLATLVRPAWITNSRFLSNLFGVGPIMLITRLLGFAFALLIMLGVGPEWILSDATGEFLLTGLIPFLFIIFAFAGLFLPLLLDYGLLELCGALFTKLMRPVFRLPGRSSIDCLASWIGDGTVGVLLTSKQYEDGYYSQREAAVISTTFSVVSLTFSIVVLSELGLDHLFLPFYGTVVGVGIILAWIMPRIPPLSLKKDTYYKEIADRSEQREKSDGSLFRWGLNRALSKARSGGDVATFFRGGAKNVLDMWMGVLPVVMALGTVALIIAEYTPFFNWIGAPVVPLLEWLQVPEAEAASKTVFVGFADMFLPAILGGGIESEMTRFIIACLSVSQLIYMSEIGGLLLGSKLPIKFHDLVIIFLLRTIIALPIIILVAHLLF